MYVCMYVCGKEVRGEETKDSEEKGRVKEEMGGRTGKEIYHVPTKGRGKRRGKRNRR